MPWVLAFRIEVAWLDSVLALLNPAKAPVDAVQGCIRKRARPGGRSAVAAQDREAAPLRALETDAEPKLERRAKPDRVRISHGEIRPVSSKILRCRAIFPPQEEPLPVALYELVIVVSGKLEEATRLELSDLHGGRSGAGLFPRDVYGPGL